MELLVSGRQELPVRLGEMSEEHGFKSYRLMSCGSKEVQIDELRQQVTSVQAFSGRNRAGT